MKSTVAYLLLVVGLAACSDSKPLSLAIPADLAPPVKQVVEKAWPKVMANCPGLDLYAADLSFAGIEDNLSFAPDHAQRIEIKIRVAERPTRIPASYRASGHLCGFGISPDGGQLIIAKDSCASVCAGVETFAENNYVKAL